MVFFYCGGVGLATAADSWHIGRMARGLLGGACVALSGAAMVLIPFLSGTAVKIALTTIGVAVLSAIYIIGQTVVGEITPVAQQGALLAIGTAISTSAGLMAPQVRFRCRGAPPT